MLGRYIITPAVDAGANSLYEWLFKDLDLGTEETLSVSSERGIIELWHRPIDASAVTGACPTRINLSECSCLSFDLPLLLSLSHLLSFLLHHLFSASVTSSGETRHVYFVVVIFY